MRRWYYILLSILLIACSTERKRDLTAQIEEWTGRVIIIPDTLQYVIKDTPIDYDISGSDFRIFTYVPHDGCTGCAMKLNEWTEVMACFDTISAYDIDLVMIASVDSPAKLTKLARQGNFNYPIAIDSAGVTGVLNNFPNDLNFRTFLLDRHNRIVAVGNPAFNPNIRNLYIKRILGHAPDTLISASVPVTLVNPSGALGTVAPCESVSRKFTLRSSSGDTLHVVSVVPDCDCTKVTLDNYYIAPGDYGYVTVSVTVDSVPGKFVKQVDLFFESYEKPLTIKVNGYNN